MTGAVELSSSRLQSHILDTLRVPPGRWYVAYSGGMDSTVLLHCLAAVAANADSRLIALHADHGLSPHAARWREHCERRCREWGIECRTTRLALDSRDKRGPEGRAREARYRWFREVAGAEGWLFTAHHCRDQAETVLERLSRGSGPRGLRGMRPVARRDGLHIVRPLLGIPAGAIREYAEGYGLDWITDESNADLSLTRNYIRQRVLPVLARRWPGIENALATSAETMADAQAICDQVAESDLRDLDDRPVRGDPSLSIAALTALDPPRQRNVLRYWLNRERGVVVGFRRLGRIQLALSRHPEPVGGMSWPPIELRPHRGRLYLVTDKPGPDAIRHWDLGAALDLDGLRLRARPVHGTGLKTKVVENGVAVAFRRGGEICRLPGRRHHHRLKQILQEAGVPPWQRPRIPLITIDGEIAAIAGLAYCAPFAAGANENGIAVEPVYERKTGTSAS